MAVLIGRAGLVACNEAAREMFGDAHSTAEGKPIGEVLPIAAGFYREAIDACHRGESLRFLDEPIKLCRDGRWQTCWFDVGLSPVVDAAGQVLGVLLVGNETTGHVRARKALHASYQRVEMALEAGGIIGTWDFDVARRTVIIDGSLARQFGVSEADARLGVPLDMLFENVHPDDRDRALAAFNEAVASGADYRDRVRTVTTDDRLHWYVTSGRPIRDEADHVVQLTGIVIDVTDHTEAVAALEQSRLRFDTLAEAVPQIIWSTDAQGNHDYFNKRWREFTGIDPVGAPPDLWVRLVHPDDWPLVSATWQDCLATGKTYDIDYRFRRWDGTYRWLRVVAMPMRDADGKILRWYGTAIDIEAAKQLDAQKEIVTRELDHRIKNLFALVGGLVSLSTRETPELAPFAETLRARLGALHQAHGLISSGGQRPAGSLERLLHELLAPYRYGTADRICLEGEDLIIQASATASVALIFHELATNAMKYGALADPEGRLRIAYERSGDWCRIEWEETFHGPPPKARSFGGFGSRLLETIVERQFHGRLSRSLSERGLSIVIHLPTAAILQPAGGPP